MESSSELEEDESPGFLADCLSIVVFVVVFVCCLVGIQLMTDDSSLVDVAPLVERNTSIRDPIRRIINDALADLIARSEECDRAGDSACEALSIVPADVFVGYMEASRTLGFCKRHSTACHNVGRRDCPVPRLLAHGEHQWHPLALVNGVCHYACHVACGRGRTCTCGPCALSNSARGSPCTRIFAQSSSPLAAALCNNTSEGCELTLR